MLVEMLWLLLLDIVLYVRSEVAHPELSECFTVNGRDYRGTVSQAGPEGTPCLYWNQTTQHLYNAQSDPDGELGLGNHNYCRNPDADVQPWCYVSENEEGIYWKYCDIPSCHMPGYLGCFLDFGTPPALSGASGTSSKLTVQACIRYCRTKGYQYAGVEAGYACFCGDPSDVGTLQPTSSSQCDQYCFGKPNEICGGDGKISVYSAWVGACHENLTSCSGVLYSPDFPEEYGPGVSCIWDILSPGSTAVELQFHIFQIPDPKDILEVRDGASGTLLMKIQGGQKPPSSVTLPTGHLWFHFQSDKEFGGPGYAITYRGLPNKLTNSTPTKETSHELYLVSTNSTFEHYSTEHAASSKALLFLAAALVLLAVCIGIIIWRYPSWCSKNPCAMVQPTTCSMLYRHKKERMGDLTCVNQSSMKSLL
ncbi:kringle containing transmembrane protein 2 S homeolog precursor [Xenopus laevis]|uniref:Kremen protein n=1 Tax=Xenopus laevis TaxID=8355 RepID=Q8AXX3_XENLA|nr:kringle containing transmembrane protein 2 S homeolog precursor [Xenopus laevis]AAI70312.1 Kremen2 [Xenopus laevis]AAN64661.1 kremen2 [Xenopus laevis]